MNDQRTVEPRPHVRRCVRWTGYNADEVTTFLGTPAWGVTGGGTCVQVGWWLYLDETGTVGAMSPGVMDAYFQDVRQLAGTR